ncbi:MAG: methylmalonyl-CoA/ethylmalonyl-CoA epimerase [Clostridiales bacterium]|nr:methylmalonyl-CoA/ethylmalonyl-CoA epimerase [Clostridiales bacterium]
MDNGILGTTAVAQIGIIVNDIERTAKKFADFFGMEVPEITLTDTYDKTSAQYKGQPTEARSKLAFLHMSNSIDIELIEPDDQPSTWREFLNTHGEGIHHIAFVIKDMQGKVNKLAEIGMPLVQKGEYTGGRYAYIDSTADLKVMIELLEND